MSCAHVPGAANQRQSKPPLELQGMGHTAQVKLECSRPLTQQDSHNALQHALCSELQARGPVGRRGSNA